MLPLMMDGVQKAKEQLREQAIHETVERLDGLLTQRFEAAGKADLKPLADLLTKKEQFEIAFNAAQTPEEQAKYQHYLTAIGWMLNGTH